MHRFTLKVSTEDQLSFVQRRLTEIGGGEIEHVFRHFLTIKREGVTQTTLAGITITIRGKSRVWLHAG